MLYDNLVEYGKYFLHLLYVVVILLDQRLMKKVPKYEKLRKYFSCCIQHRAVTSTYFTSQGCRKLQTYFFKMKKGTWRRTYLSSFSFFKVGLSHSPKKLFYLLQWKPFKDCEKCFLFHLESSFRSEDIQIFIFTFWSCRKKRLDWKDKVIFKIYDVTAWLTNNYNPHIAQYLTK